jgi:hypothetical protein
VIAVTQPLSEPSGDMHLEAKVLDDRAGNATDQEHRTGGRLRHNGARPGEPREPPLCEPRTALALRRSRLAKSLLKRTDESGVRLFISHSSLEDTLAKESIRALSARIEKHRLGSEPRLACRDRPQTVPSMNSLQLFAVTAI